MLGPVTHDCYNEVVLLTRSLLSEVTTHQYKQDYDDV